MQPPASGPCLTLILISLLPLFPYTILFDSGWIDSCSNHSIEVITSMINQDWLITVLHPLG